VVDIYGHWILGEELGRLDDALGGVVERKPDENAYFRTLERTKAVIN
jgi:hypothetical protein